MEWSLTGLPLPIVLRPPSPLTDDELTEFSIKNKPYRIEKNAKGELEIMTPVGLKGGRREIRIGSELDLWAEGQSGTVVGANVGFNLPDGLTLSPDAAWLSQEQWDGLTEEQRERYPAVCPAFLVEVLSRTDLVRVGQAKMETWISNGAQLAWLLDPFSATLTIYRPGQEPETLIRPDVVEAGPPVAGFRLNTSRLWASS